MHDLTIAPEVCSNGVMLQPLTSNLSLLRIVTTSLVQEKLQQKDQDSPTVTLVERIEQMRQTVVQRIGQMHQMRQKAGKQTGTYDSLGCD